MEILVYASLCPQGQERETAYKLLEEALRREYGLTQLPEIEREKQGKPYFPEYPHICFNISHSHGGAVCAIHHLPIGVDVEKLRPAPKRLASGRDDAEFFHLWTGREASIKRMGERWIALLREDAPDERCCWLEDLLPGWIIAVCPTENGQIRGVCISENAKET